MILAVSDLRLPRGQVALSKQFLDKTKAAMTNLPSPCEALTVCRSRREQSIFRVPSSGDVGMDTCVFSNAGGVRVGLVADEFQCPEPDQIIDRLGPEFAHLLRRAVTLRWADSA